MNKKLIRLTESNLRGIVKESVRNIMKDYATPPSNEEIAFFKFIHNGNVTPIQCSKAGVDYDLLKKYHHLMHHCYADGHNNPITEDPKPLEDEIKRQFMANYRRLQKQGWLKENFTSKRRSVEDFGEPTPELDTTAFKNELTKLVKYLGMAQGNSKGIQSCIKMITQISNELKQHSEDTDFNVKRMLQGLEQATKQLSNGQTQPAVKIVNQIIMEVDRTVNAIKARPNKWNGGIMAESNLHKIVKESVNKVVRESIEGDLYTQFQAIDKSLSQIDNETYVSRFYSDENQITIAVSRSVNRLGRQRIIEMMKNYGYSYSTSGGNGKYIMMTFEPIIVTESIRSIPRSMKESINNLADNPQYERFIESLYDLVGQYYNELGEETIVDNLRHVTQWVEEGGLDK